MEELVKIVTKFSESGWDLIETPSKAWLVANKKNDIIFTFTKELIKVIEQADIECGSCGCEFDLLYKKALSLLRSA